MDDRTRDRIKACQSRVELNRILSGLRDADLTNSDLYLIHRALDENPASTRTRIAYLGSCNLDPLPVFTRVFSSLGGQDLDSYVGSYNQYFQEVLDTGSDLRRFDPEVVFLCVSIRDIAPRLVTSFRSLTDEEKEHDMDEAFAHLTGWTKSALESFRATILLSNMVVPPLAASGLSDLNDSCGQTELFTELNLRLLREYKEQPRVHLFDMNGLASAFGRDRVHDPKMYYLAKREWNDPFVRCLAAHLSRLIRAAKGLSKKCLVVDLDNTLWGGVVGEEGPENVKVGMGDPVGEAFLDFQHRVLSLKHRGVILAVCSKNNREDVEEVFEKRPEMPLRLADFSVVEATWNEKTDGIRNIASTLNIGLDSLVFIDDSPFECNLVRELLPEVTTLQLPTDPAEFPAVIDDLTAFDRLVITKEDLAKTDQYRQSRAREEHRQSTSDLESYLRSLCTEVVIRPAEAKDLPRVHQLFTKTNQFNLTTTRYSMGQIESFQRNRDVDLTVVEASDRFGSLGTIGLYLLKIDKDPAFLDSFVLSCRALGRGIESAVMNHVKKQAAGMGKTAIESRLVPTPKNKPVRGFCEGQGFDVTSDGPDGEKSYRLDLQGSRMTSCDWIKVITPEKA